jgi:SAM-dependent methyltransferase
MNKRASRTAKRAVRTKTQARRRPVRPKAAPRPSAGELTVYPRGFVFGRGEADPFALSLSGLKIARALRALRPVRGRVLELGCGGGQYLRALRRRRPDLELFAVDLDTGAVAAALHIPEVSACRADVSDLPFPPASFAAVLGFDILEHVARPKRVLAEVARVLAPGGRFHLYVPCEGNPGTVYQVRGHADKARWGGHVQQFTSDQVVDLITQAGLRLIKVRYADYWLTQQLDHLFFSRLAKSPDPGKLWAAQSLAPGGGLAGLALRWARRILSAASWLESVLRRSRGGSMGVHLTAVKPIVQAEAEED